MKQRAKVQHPAGGKASRTAGGAVEVSAPLDGSRAKLPRAAVIGFVVATCLLCLRYALYTDQTWEDSLITLRHSENLLKGEGLTFNTGGRVHGFTSPVNVLLLAVCHFVTGQSSYAATFWLYRVFTVAALAISGVFLLKTLYETPPRWNAALWFFAVVYLFDVKTIAFCINGMETGFVLGFLAWAVYLIAKADPEHWRARGLCWAGLMWSRPDAFIYVAGLALGEFVFLSLSRRELLVSYVKSGVVCIIFYGPWVLWAWSYYGSPIPHTITAKANAEMGWMQQLGSTFDLYPASLISKAAQVFRPIYYGETAAWAGHVGWGRVINGATNFVGIVGLLYFLFPTRDYFGRAMSLAFVVLCSYLAYMPVVYPWYMPPMTLVGAMAFTRAATTAALSASEHSTAGAWYERRKMWVGGVLTALAVGAVALFYPAALEEKIQQAEIEMGNRAEIGKWLKANAKPTDTVYLEPLGYIGYYSDLHIDDFPGLVSPKVVQLRRELPADPNSIRFSRQLLLSKVKADWVVLRFVEYQALSQLPMIEEFNKNYTLAREFDVNPKLNSYKYLPGEFSLRFDAGFAVFHRNATATN